MLQNKIEQKINSCLKRSGREPPQAEVAPGRAGGRRKYNKKNISLIKNKKITKISLTLVTNLLVQHKVVPSE